MMKNNNLLRAIASAQVIRNLNNTALIEKSEQLQYCKRNILLTKIIIWDRVFCRITQALLHGRDLTNVELNVNRDCVDYVKLNELSNPFFAEFFFNFHEPLTLAFLRRMRKELDNGMPLAKKFKYVATEITELLNIAYIELDGMDISCESFGGKPICPSWQVCEKQECDNPANIFFVMMNDEYRMEKGLFESILDVAMSYLKSAKEKIIMVIDYKNMEQTDYVFGPRAKARYESCCKIVEQIYFYNWKAGLKFGDEFAGLEPYLIPDKAGLNLLINTWKNKRELIQFGNSTIRTK